MKNKINFIFITMILFPLFEFKADIDKNIEIYNFYFEEIAKKDRIEALLILNILELAQKRSQYTLDFWDRYINFLNNFNKIIFITIDRMRNPSKHLDDEILNRKILDYDFLNFIFEINHVYDRYATLLNVGYENLLSDKSKEYLDKIINNKNFN